MMTALDDLIEKLTDLRSDIANTLSETAAQAAEVRVAVNPAWAVQHALDGDRELAWHLDEESGEVAVYLPDAGQVDGAPYLPGAVAESLGWS
jgi:hypothetical protein